MLCRRCDTDKPETDFQPHKAYASGRSTWCRECHREANREWYAANKAKQNAKAVAWRASNPETAANVDQRYKQKHRAKLAAANAEWGRNNKEKRRASTAKRKAARLRATPPWANHAEIARIYRLAHELQEMTGVPMHVDHIVPLQHERVCGLHCERNLQIIPARFNEAKKNYWWPDMFVEQTKAPEPVQQPLFTDGRAA